MNKTKYSLEQFYIAKHLLRWTLLIFLVALSVGILVALFLWLLDMATAVLVATLATNFSINNVVFCLAVVFLIYQELKHCNYGIQKDSYCC